VDAVDADTLIDAWLTVPDAAEQLGIDAVKVRQLIRDRKILAVRRGEPSRLEMPAAFIRDGVVLKGLPGLLTLLADAGFSDDEVLRWLFTVDDTLPGTPVQALAENRATETKRRAQALAF
jgi:excisionase family DNA binding protein